MKIALLGDLYQTNENVANHDQKNMENRTKYYIHTKAISFLEKKPLLASVFLGVAKDIKTDKIIICSVKVRFSLYFKLDT